MVLTGSSGCLKRAPRSPCGSKQRSSRRRQYTSLSGEGRRQARRLITPADAEGLTPLYCFYNATMPAQRADWPLLPSDVAAEQWDALSLALERSRSRLTHRDRHPLRAGASSTALARTCLPAQSAESGIGRVLAALEGGFESGDDTPTPTVRDESEVPDYVLAVRAGAPLPRRGRRVPARRVTVVDYDRAAQ